MRKRWVITGAALLSVAGLVAGVFAWRAMRPAESPRPPAPSPTPSPVGLWMVPVGQVEEANARLEAEEKNYRFGGPDPFFFDGETLTMRLLPMKVWEWHTADDYYRLSSRWEGDDLFWLPPFGEWTKLASFRDGAFQVEHHDVVWRYERVPLDGVPPGLQPLLKPRDKHDYSIKPDQNGGLFDHLGSPP
jgi:hypothetical protein